MSSQCPFCVWFGLTRRNSCHPATSSGQRIAELARASFIQQCLAILLINLVRLSCWVGPWTLARTESSKFQICLPHGASVVMSFLKLGPPAGLELLPGDRSPLPWLAGSHSHMNLNRAQLPSRQQERAERWLARCQCSQGSSLAARFTTHLSCFPPYKSLWRCGGLNTQTHLDTLMILPLLPQLQVELWATKELINEKRGPSVLMAKAVLTAVGVSFPGKLRVLQILPPPVPSAVPMSAGQRCCHLILLSSVCCCQLASFQADTLAWNASRWNSTTH